MGKEFIINKHITLRLEDGKTNIYINGELFIHCKYILVRKKIDEISSLVKVNSIDEISRTVDKSLELQEPNLIGITPEVEFWVHSSNLQVWAENNYNTKLLHRNLAFPLLKKLSDVGNQKAKTILKEEIVKRFMNGPINVQEYLVEECYLDLITKEEKYTLFIIEKEERIIKKIEKLIKKPLNLDTRYCHYLQSYVLKKGKVSELNLVECNLEKVPKLILKLKDLEVLRLSANPFKKLPQWIGELHTLKRLEVRGKLEELPESIGDLKSLEILDLSLNNLTTIPYSIKNLSSLKELDLKYNRLNILPEIFGKLNSLEKLDLSHNDLKSLPDSINQLGSLKKLET